MLENILKAHENGKIYIGNKVPIKTREDLALVYTPGVAMIVKRIEEDKSEALKYTIIGNTVGMFTDGTAILGLGNVGPVAGMPVMEGKAMIYREFAGLNAYPLLLGTTDSDSIVETICNLAPSFSLIHLEDIAAPRCFYILDELEKRLDIPVFHDDQFGTAIVVLAGLINAIKFLKVDRNPRIVINGAGAAGLAIAKVLYNYGLSDIIICDSQGIISQDRQDLNEYKKLLLSMIGKTRRQGALQDAIVDADIFIGVSAANVLSAQMVETMSKKAIIFALANPTPEIIPTVLNNFKGIIATGRSDFPNQINNALGYPGFVKGIINAGIKKITIDHIINTAKAIASIIPEEQLSENNIIPDVFNKEVVPKIIKSFT